jgi:Ca2+-transporting ATPase
VAAAKAGIEKAALEAQYPRVHEIPFTSEKKRMTTLHSLSKGQVAYSKGALEVILDACRQTLAASGVSPLDRTGKEAILAMGQQMADQALRVLAVAYKPDVVNGDAEQRMIFLGLLDPAIKWWTLG